MHFPPSRGVFRVHTLSLHSNSVLLASLAVAAVGSSHVMHPRKYLGDRLLPSHSGCQEEGLQRDEFGEPPRPSGRLLLFIDEKLPCVHRCGPTGRAVSVSEPLPSPMISWALPPLVEQERRPWGMHGGMAALGPSSKGPAEFSGIQFVFLTLEAYLSAPSADK